MQSQSASPPTAPWRSARVVLQPYHSCRRAPGFKTQQSDGLSLTPSCLSVSHSASILHPPPSNLPHAHTSTPSLQFIIIFFLFHLHSAFPLVLSWLLDLWVLSHSLHSSSPVCHQGWISSLHLPPFFYLFIYFYPLAVTIPLFLCLPCLHSRSPSVFFTFWQTSASLY